jgi:hypothetical protein
MKTIIGSILLLSSLTAVAQPLSPMDGYETSKHSKTDLNRFWNRVKGIEKNLKGKDCFKRAMIWSYSLNKHENVDSKKVFMHYTNKFNREIDDMGRSGAGARLGRIFSSNKGWDFHVAPAVSVDGVDYVLDPHLRKGPETTEQWVEFLTERGESRLKYRQKDLLKDLRRARKRLARSRRNKTMDLELVTEYRKSVREIQNKLKYLGLTEDPKQKIDIKCKKITNINEFDLNQETQWCYYQEASMYYFATLELRLLNYGNLTGPDMRNPITDSKYHTEKNYAQGARNYSHNRFETKYLEGSLDEFKTSKRPESFYEL